MSADQPQDPAGPADAPGAACSSTGPNTVTGTDAGPGTNATNGAAAPAGRPSLIDYPSAFPIKVMGQHVPGFEEAMVAVAKRFDAGFDSSSIERRPSKGGNYMGLTLTVTATSREQLDELYRELSSHPLVKVVL